MRRIPFGMLIMLAGALQWTGCSVKEYREACPCRLVLDLSEVDTAVVRAADLYVSVPDGYVHADVIEDEFIGKEYVLDVPRTVLNVSISDGASSMISEDGLNIPLGEECPPVFMHSSVINADCEMWREVVRMRKNHCVIDMYVKGEESYDARLTVKGGIDGYDALGRPQDGLFECGRYPDPEGRCRITVPRQKDDSLVLEIDDGSGVMKCFALGVYIESAGYDWTAPDLEDISMVLDFAVSHIALKIQGWEEEFVFDVII
ncbi:MAG: hypothetical protein IJZ98_05705 [Bacteroidales bacterium]|nr:hypothetical protein [Bacteroidales bacterium]